MHTCSKHVVGATTAVSSYLVTHQGSRIHLESIKMVDKFIVKWNSCTIGEWELDFLPSIKLAYNADDN